MIDNKYEWFEIICHSKHLKLKTDNDEKKERESWDLLLMKQWFYNRKNKNDLKIFVIVKI